MSPVCVRNIWITSSITKVFSLFIFMLNLFLMVGRLIQPLPLCPPVAPSASEKQRCSDKWMAFCICWAALPGSFLLVLQWVTGNRRDEPNRALDPVRHQNQSERNHLETRLGRPTTPWAAWCSLGNGGSQQSGYLVGLEHSFSPRAEGETRFSASVLSSFIWLT